MPPKRTIEGARKPPWLHAALVLYADVDVGTDTAIFAAIRNNDITRLKTLLGAGANANARGERGVPALMYARAYGSLNAVKLLLDAGADVNSSGGLGATALMWSVTEPEKVALLVSRGRCQAKSKMGRTALRGELLCFWPHCTTGTTVWWIFSFVSRGADIRATDEGLLFSVQRRQCVIRTKCASPSNTDSMLTQRMFRWVSRR